MKFFKLLLLNFVFIALAISSTYDSVNEATSESNNSSPPTEFAGTPADSAINSFEPYTVKKMVETQMLRYPEVVAIELFGDNYNNVTIKLILKQNTPRKEKYNIGDNAKRQTISLMNSYGFEEAYAQKQIGQTTYNYVISYH